MQFPTELTKQACRTRRRELRLICMYFFNTRFFPVSAMAGPAGWRWLLPGGPAASMQPPGFWVGTSIRGTSPQCHRNRRGLSPASVLAEWWEAVIIMCKRDLRNLLLYVHVPRQEAEQGPKVPVLREPSILTVTRGPERLSFSSRLIITIEMQSDG